MRKLTRDFFRPKGWTVVATDEALGVEVYSDKSGLVAMGFAGKRGRPDFHTRFKSAERLATYCADFVAGVRKAVTDKAEYRAQVKAAAAAHDVAVGDVFSSSWGYEQTNVDFYEVIAVSGCSATIKKIGSQYEATGHMSGNTVPVPGAFLKDAQPMRKRINVYNGSPSLKIASYASASRLDPVIVGGVKCFPAQTTTSYA